MEEWEKVREISWFYYCFVLPLFVSGIKLQSKSSYKVFTISSKQRDKQFALVAYHSHNRDVVKALLDPGGLFFAVLEGRLLVRGTYYEFMVER